MKQKQITMEILMERLQLDLLAMPFFTRALAAYPAQKDSKQSPRQPKTRWPTRQKIRALLTLFGITFALLLGGWWLVKSVYAAAPYEIVCQADGNGPEEMLCTAIVEINTMPQVDTLVISVTSTDCLFTLVDADGDYGNGAVGLPRIERHLTIRAMGGRAIIERAGTVPQFRLLESTANLTIENVTLRNGETKYKYSGGAIYAHQLLRLNNVILMDHTSYRGGAIYVAGPLFMDQVIATGNRTRSSSPSHGGAIAVDGNLTATHITVTHNLAEDCGCGSDQAHGGGIYVGGSAVISAAHFFDNRSVQNAGGGLYVTGQLTLSNSEFISNAARYNGGGLNVEGDLTLSSSDFISNSSSTDGGGANVNGTLTLSDVNFIRNVAVDLGGVSPMATR